MNETGRFQDFFGTRCIVALAAFLIPLVLLVAARPATAEVGAQGSAEVVLGEGPSGKALVSAGTRISAGGAASATALSGDRTKVTLPVQAIYVPADDLTGRTTVSLAGSIVFGRQGRKVHFRQLELVSTADESFVRATVGESRFRALILGPAAKVDRRVGTVSLSGRSSALGERAATLLSNRLGLGGLAAARAGQTTLASQAAFEDPYAETCQLPATSKVPGDLTEAPLPGPIDGGTTATGNGISWGLRSGLRNYLFFLPEGQGVMQGIDGGALVPPLAPPPAPQTPSGFSFPFESGSWDLGEEAAGDERVLLEGSGSILLCHKTQFRILLSNPKIVIDGFDAGLLFDVDTNVLGEWIPQARVRLANLVTSTATFQQVDGTATWTNVPVVLTDEGSKALRLAPFSPTFRYQAGQSLESMSFTLSSAAG